MRDEFFWLGQMNKATIVTNHEGGLLDLATAKKAALGVKTVLDAGVDPANRVNKVIAFEPKMIEAVGTEVTVIHVGRSSQDMHSTFRGAILRDNALRVAESVERVIAKLLAMAEEHQDTVMPSYTNGVAAQPTTFAHYLLAFVEGFKRDRARIGEFFERVNVCPMGSCVLNGTGWPLDREAMARRLGFARPARNAFDATQVMMVDLPVELAQIEMSLALHVGAFVADVMVQYAQPRPWMLMAAGKTYVSSAMPQKRNPGVLINTRGYASDIVSEASGVITRAHNVPTGMIDGKSVKIHSSLSNATVSLMERLVGILDSLVVNKERALEELSLDWTASQEIADRLMREYKVPFRVGHHVASGMVTFARANGILPLTFPYAEMQRIYAETIEKEWPEGDRHCPMSEAEFHEALDPKSILAHRATSGSANPEEVKRMIDLALGELAALQKDTAEKRCAIDESIAALDNEFSTFL